eukprot:gene5697-7863_t
MIQLSYFQITCVFHLLLIAIYAIHSSSSTQISTKQSFNAAGKYYGNQFVRQVLVVAGNFTIGGEVVNIAQYDILTGIWSNKYQAELYLYGESNGVIWDIAVNRTSQPINKMYVAGLFDTVSKTSQVQFCSVGAWDGIYFEKVGESLCPRGGMESIKIQTIVLGNNGDLFVGGTFETTVWDGLTFVVMFHTAQFNAKRSSWLPLSGGQLRTREGSAKVNSLAWDAQSEVLYIGGLFNRIDNRSMTNGLAQWTESLGVVEFTGGGVANYDNDVWNCMVQSIAFEPQSQSLFVSGTFQRVGGAWCQGIAVWHKPSQVWKCLHKESYFIGTVTTMLLTDTWLYLSGWAAASSSWEGKNWQSPYAIARLNIAGYIEQYDASLFSPSNNSYENNTTNSNNSSSANSTNKYLNFHRSYHKQHKNLFESEHFKQRQLRKQSKRIKNKPNYVRNFDQNMFAQSDAVDSSVTNSATIMPVSVNRTHAPTSAPTQKPLWFPQWSWLPGFTGGNGPILRLTAGSSDFEHCLFIAGAFDNYPAVVIWRISHTTGDVNITGIGGKQVIEGLITSVTQAYLPYEPLPPPVPPPQPVIHRDYTFFILFACVLVGIIMGLGFAVGCFSKTYSSSHTEANTDVQMAMSLMTLSDGGNNAVDFRQCFERAMKARHLPTHESLLMINPKEIVLSRIIGEGSFGRVWSGQWRNNAVAVKEFVFAQAAIVGGSLERHNIIEEIVGEAGIMACLRHPKILQLYGCSLTMQAIWIVSELCNRGSLRMVLNDESVDLPLIKKLSISMDVADGMLYLHTRTPPIIHRDLKSQNIFVTEPAKGHFVAKIGDWGSARAIALTGGKSMTHGVGTACWLSPEVIKYAHFSKSSDIYAYGIVLWEIFTRQEIYEGLSAAQIIAKVAYEGLRPQVPRDCPWEKVMTGCWRTSAEERPNFQSILLSLSKIYSVARSKIIQTKLNAKPRPKIMSNPNITSNKSNSGNSSSNNYSSDHKNYDGNSSTNSQVMTGNGSNTSLPDDLLDSMSLPFVYVGSGSSGDHNSFNPHSAVSDTMNVFIRGSSDENDHYIYPYDGLSTVPGEEDETSLLLGSDPELHAISDSYIKQYAHPGSSSDKRRPPPLPLDDMKPSSSGGKKGVGRDNNQSKSGSNEDDLDYNPQTSRSKAMSKPNMKKITSSNSFFSHHNNNNMQNNSDDITPRVYQFPRDSTTHHNNDSNINPVSSPIVINNDQSTNINILNNNNNNNNNKNIDNPAVRHGTDDHEPNQTSSDPSTLAYYLLLEKYNLSQKGSTDTT